jgi:serine/threonine protein phosphatase PrpC
MKDKEKLTYCGLSDMGKQRTNNEDAYVAEQLDKNTVLAVAIDGVGGYEGGEVAAEIAKTEIPKYLHEFRNGERLELLKQAVICANNAIYDQRQRDTTRPNMSCVLTSAIVDKGRKVIDMVHVGDTRMYQYRHGELRKLSHDHSLIGYREEVGDLTEEQAMHHPQRNVISRDVGSAKHEVEDRDFLEAAAFPLLPNSTLLLCSDGLTDLITSKQIVAILEQQISLKEKAKSLIAAANEAGGKDNVTVVLVEYLAEEKVEPVPEVIEKDPAEPAEDNNGDVLPPKDEGKKREGKKLIVCIWCGIVGLLLGACVALGLLTMKKTDQVKELEQQVLQLEKQIEELKQNDTADVDTVSNTLVDSVQSPERTRVIYEWLN